MKGVDRRGGRARRRRIRKDSRVRLLLWRRAPSGSSSTRWKRVSYALAAMLALTATATATPAIATAARLTYIAAAASTSATRRSCSQRERAGPRSLGPASTRCSHPTVSMWRLSVRGADRPRPDLARPLLSRREEADAHASNLGCPADDPRWAPDDSWIAVTDGNSLVAVPLHGKARVLTTGTIAGASFAPRLRTGSSLRRQRR